MNGVSIAIRDHFTYLSKNLMLWYYNPMVLLVPLYFTVSLLHATYLE